MPSRNLVNRLKRILQLAGQSRPLFFLGVPGIVILWSGLLLGVRVILIFRRIHTLAVGYAMISVLLAIIGSLALFTSLILHSVRGLLLDSTQSRTQDSHKPHALSNALQLVGQRHPLRLLGGIGTISLVTGVAMGLHVVSVYSRTQTLAIGHTLISMLLVVVGNLGLLAGIILHSVRGLFETLTQHKHTLAFRSRISPNQPPTKSPNLTILQPGLALGSKQTLARGNNGGMTHHRDAEQTGTIK